MLFHRRAYIVNRAEENFISPEETLLDSSGDHMAIESPISRKTVGVFYLIVFVMMFIFVAQAFRLQIIRGKEFFEIADKSRFFSYPVPSLRGIIYDRNGKSIVENMPIFDLVAVPAQFTEESRLYLGDKILNENAGKGVFAVQKNITKDEAIRLQNKSIPGLYVVSYAKRSYLYGEIFSHVIGYTSQVSPGEREEAPSYRLNERIGRLGAESFYDDVLRSEPYEIFLDPEVMRNQSPVLGDSIYTNLDIEMQKKLYESIVYVFKSAGVQRGAAVVQDVKTGAVLAMISMPSFDPNNINENIFNNRNKPLFNRAVSGLYSPGSTIKPLLGMAGLEEKIVDENTMIFADGAIEIQSETDPSHFFVFEDWKVHGWTEIKKAISDSVDIYFYALGGGLPAGQAGYENIRGLGIDKIETYLKNALINQKTGIDLPGEAYGFVPSKKWKKETKNDNWYLGDTYNVSIGQGDMLVTPIWLNTQLVAIANGGYLMEPQVIQKEHKVLAKLPFSEETMSTVREGMRRTVTNGTGVLLNDLPQTTAAKTGTAQVAGRGLNSLFTVYGPYEDPEIAMTVLVENIPQSQSLAIRIAKDFLMWYFNE